MQNSKNVFGQESGAYGVLVDEKKRVKKCNVLVQYGQRKLIVH
jgi:hypothetical protein